MAGIGAHSCVLWHHTYSVVHVHVRTHEAGVAALQYFKFTHAHDAQGCTMYKQVV